MNRWTEGLYQLRQYPSAIAGALLILFLVLLSLYTVIAIPYSQAIEQWRGGVGAESGQRRSGMGGPTARWQSAGDADGRGR